MTERRDVARARRVVIKIGSKGLATDDSIFERLAKTCAALHARERDVVLVSSGAIALGMRRLAVTARPKSMNKLQAAAAVGQAQLMRRYEDAFMKQGLVVGQVLLTHADLADRERGNNARAALAALLEQNAVPILNENDSVATDEIRFGDNDALSAMVVALCEADLLVLLSDVAGLLDAKGKRVPLVNDARTEAVPLVRKDKSAEGTGGMQSKVEAARRATEAGAWVVLADARDPAALDDVLAGKDVGTAFAPSGKRLAARKHWIAYTLRPKGDVLLDEGAARAIAGEKRSVLAVGVVAVRGDFAPGDAVRLVATDGRELGRGLSRMTLSEAARVAGSKTGESDVIVHRDDLVTW